MSGHAHDLGRSEGREAVHQGDAYLDFGGREFEARAANELALLPHGSAIDEMLADYAVMRDQVRACNLL